MLGSMNATPARSPPQPGCGSKMAELGLLWNNRAIRSGGLSPDEGGLTWGDGFCS